MKRVLLVLTGMTALALGCGGGSKETKADAKPAAETTVAAPLMDDMVNHCVKMREQLFLCKDQAIDMLMDERAKANPDFAKQVADAAQKTAMRDQGLKELEADGGGPVEPRQAKCKEMVSKMPAQVPQAWMTEYTNANTCWDKPCADRVNCLRNFTALGMQMQAAPAPAAAPAQ